MNKNIALILAPIFLLAMGGLFVTQSKAYPEPSLVPVSWQFTFTDQVPRTISVRGVDGRSYWYWYLPYKVVNHSDAEHYFVPEFTVATDQGDIATANRGIPPFVFNAIKKRSANRLLEDPLLVSGRLLIGDDLAKESVAIWPVFNHDVDEVRIFISGLSGESKTIQVPGTTKRVALRKSLMITYHTPGPRPAGSSPQDQPIILKDRIWVMR